MTRDEMLEALQRGVGVLQRQNRIQAARAGAKGELRKKKFRLRKPPSLVKRK